MIGILLMLVGGLALSAFFSGSETGFYRINRARLLITALDGDFISRGLWWLVNNPSVFVATVLVGNNVANYLVSLSMVMATEAIARDWPSAEFVVPILFAPLLFIYCELLPKNVFLAAPNRLLRRCALPFAVAIVLFAPVSVLLWLVNKVIEFAGQKSPEELRLVLARRELAEILEEGQAVGLLRPTQQALAQGTLTLSGQPISNYIIPVSRFPHVTSSASPGDVVATARQFGRRLLPVDEIGTGSRATLGYVRAGECLLAGGGELPLRKTLEFNERQPMLTVLTQMQAAGVELAKVVNRRKQLVGYVTRSRLREALLAA
jgi:putative hemolysin